MGISKEHPSIDFATYRQPQDFGERVYERMKPDTKKMRFALKVYQSSAYKLINDLLRKELSHTITLQEAKKLENEGSFEDAVENAYLDHEIVECGILDDMSRYDCIHNVLSVIPKLDNILLHAPPLEDAVKVYRGVSKDDFMLQQLIVARREHITFKEYVSTSFSWRVASEFALSQGAIFTIILPRGTRGVILSGDEKEFLLPRSCMFKFHEADFERQRNVYGRRHYILTLHSQPTGYSDYDLLVEHVRLKVNVQVSSREIPRSKMPLGRNDGLLSPPQSVPNSKTKTPPPSDKKRSNHNSKIEQILSGTHPALKPNKNVFSRLPEVTYESLPTPQMTPRSMRSQEKEIAKRISRESPIYEDATPLLTPKRKTPPKRSGTPKRKTPPKRSGTPKRKTPPKRSGTPKRKTPPKRSGTPKRKTPPKRSGTPKRKTPPKQHRDSFLASIGIEPFKRSVPQIAHASSAIDPWWVLAKRDKHWKPNSLESLENEYNWEYKNHWQSTGIFPTFRDFRNAVRDWGRYVRVTPAMDLEIMFRPRKKTIREVEALVKTYQFPRDVQSIVKAITNEDPLPHPIVLWINGHYKMLSGNTRMDVAFIYGVNPVVLVIDVDNLLSYRKSLI